MTFLQHIAAWWLERGKRSEQRSASSGDSYQVLYDYFGGKKTASGEKVDSTTAMTLSAVFCAVRLISETIASLPIKMFKKRDDGGRDRITNHAITNLLNYNPNIEMTGFDLIQAMGQDALLHGNGYAEIIRDGRGEPIELWYLDARRTFPKRERDGGPLIYINRTMNGEERKLQPDRVLHLKGLGNGIVGRSVIGLARESMGLSLAAEKMGAAFFGNSARPSGILETDGSLDKEAVKHLKESWAEMHQGAGKAGSVPVLEEGLKWKAMSIPPEDAQFLETRQFQVVDVARWFNVPPHLLYDLSRATFSNIESQQIQFVQFTLMPWIVKWENILRWRLETEDEARVQRIFPQFEVKALQRGDVKSRFTAYKLAIESGWQTREETRRLEELDPRKGLDKPLKPMNMDTIDEDGNTEPKPVATKPAPVAPAIEPEDDAEADEEPSTTDAERAAAVVRSHFPSMMHIAGKLLRREAKAARTASRKPDGFLRWAESYYERIKPQIVEDLGPAFEALAGSLLAVEGRDATDEVLGAVAGRANAAAVWHIAAAKRELVDAATSTLAAGLSATLSEIISRRETSTDARHDLVERWVDAIKEAIEVKEMDYATKD